MFNPKEHIIETERLILRPIKEQDLDLIVALYTCPKLMRHMTVPPFGIEQAKSYFERCLKITRAENPKGLIWIWQDKATNKAIGLIGCYNLDLAKGETETGAMLLEEFHGKGLASEAYTGLLPLLIDELHLKQLKASCEVENAASVRLYRKLGFELLEECESKSVQSCVLTRERFGV